MHLSAALLFDSDVCLDPHGFETDQGYETGEERPRETKRFEYQSSSLPFGQQIPLQDVSGPTYITAQTLVQQVAYGLSDKVFTYSPETFELDLALKSWAVKAENNAFGRVTGVTSMQTRAGAGSVALGYMFSEDFDVSKRGESQSIVASSGSLRQLRPALDKLSLMYSIANPVVAHIAAVDYAASSSSGLVTDYATPLALADELGLGLVSSSSTYEAQHMSLLATLLAKIVPTLHVYDGINIGRETTQVIDVFGIEGLHGAYEAVAKSLEQTTNKRRDDETKLTDLVDAFNNQLGTDYQPFEYYGHPEAESVLVVFGSVEGSLAAQLAYALSNNGEKVGAINVRVYRPFLEAGFVASLPATVKHVAVLGQVKDGSTVQDSVVTSLLYNDVLAAITFSSRFPTRPAVRDIKYPREEVWTPSKMLFMFQHLETGLTAEDRRELASNERPRFDLLGPSVTRYSFWDADDSPSVNLPAVVGQLLSRGRDNVTLRTGHDNLAQGGIVRSDIRVSSKSIEAPYSITASNVTFIGDEKILKSFDVAVNIASKGSVIVKLPGSRELDAEKLEKKLPARFRADLAEKEAELYLLDPAASSRISENPHLESFLSQLAVLGFTSAGDFGKLGKLATINGDLEIIQMISGDLEQALRRVDIPSSWATAEDQENEQALLPDISVNSFVPFDKSEQETAGSLKPWVAAAQGLTFKEATGAAVARRPDLGFKTSVVHVKEHRRLTPENYDRNVFHIEFDLGDSGLTYNIGEALGIHAENNASEVEAFMKWYGLNPLDIVEVPARENNELIESRTVYQSLMQNIDIFGRPPKRFYEQLAGFATESKEKKDLLALGGSEGAVEFKRRAEVDTVTYADVLADFPSARPAFHELVRLITPMKRREYSIASSQKATPNSVSLLIVTVAWVDPQGRDRFGQATRYLDSLRVGDPVTVSIKPSVMKLPAATTAPLIMAGLGTGLAPFRAFVQERAVQKAQGADIGPILLYMGSRHQREEYLYGEEWEAYRDAGIVTLLGQAFSRDQPHKIYIQDRMRETLSDVRDAYLAKEGSFYLCGPTWPVPDVTEVLEEAIVEEAKMKGEKKVDARREIEKLKDESRYVLEVY